MIKKQSTVLYAVLGWLAVCACTIPSGVEIIANPQMKLPASVDFSEKFAEGIRNGFSGENMAMYDCIKVENIQTFLVSITLLESTELLKNTNLQDQDSWPSVDTPLITNKIDPDLNPGNENPPVPIPLSGLTDFMGDGFEFKDIPSKLYVSGSNDDLLKMLKIELYNGTDPVADIPNSTITTIDTIPSNLAGNLSADADQPDYLGLTLPAGGNVIDIERVINSKKGVQLKYDISLQGGQPGTVTSAMLNAEITVELLIWLPLKFIANNDKGAMIKFPGMFEADKDLFGRSSQEDSMFNMMSRIRVEIGMNSDAFKDGIMEMVDNSYVIQCPLESKAIVLDLGMDDVGYINRNYPFSPEIGIWFGNGTGPTIPRGLGVMSLGFDADIKYKL